MMRKLILLSFVFLPLLLIAQTAFLPFYPQNGNTSNDRDGFRVWQPISFETGDWNDNDQTYERDSKSGFVYSEAFPTVPIQINGYQGYDHQVFQWLPKSHVNYTYNNDFTRILQVVYQDSVEENPIQPVFRYTYQYDGQNRLTEIYSYAYDLVNLTWSPSKRLHSMYTGNFLTETVEWNSVGDMLRFTYEYDNAGRLSIKQKYNSQDSTGWLESSKFIYTYNTNDISTNDGFINYYSTVYAFNYPMVQNGVYGFYNDYYGMVSLITEGYMYGANYLANHRYSYTYNNYGQLTEQLTEFYTSSWANWSMFTITYDLNANPEYQTFLSWWGDSWGNVRRTTFSWTDSTPNDDQVAQPSSNLNVTTYPNPFQDQIQVRTASKITEPITLKLFNIKGQCVQEMKAQPNQSLSLDSSQLTNGIYLMKATQGQITKTIKVMKVK